ncbi:MAG TPA: FAD-dependent oxidoreductase, partial [Homoserinimonas sp.]|nr:FAD-dependent oxidoreductase [Homoserinimonas sp.]
MTMTEPDFQHIVVGAGPMGASAAKYLAQAGERVLLLAPEEPADAAELGRYTSHGDHSRLARGLDNDSVWARMAKASIDRYRALEQESGVPFFNEVGCITVVEGATTVNEDKLGQIEAVAASVGIAYDRLPTSDLIREFPQLAANSGTVGYVESQNAGWVNPRDFVRAQIASGEQHGLWVSTEPMQSAEVMADRIEVTTAVGSRLTAGQALFAMGAHSAFDMPVPVDEQFMIYARTVVHVPLSDDQAAQLATLPCMIVRGVDDDRNCYVVPPIRYPDGEWYMKIGGGRRTQELTGRGHMTDWFASNGDRDVAQELLMRLGELVPAATPTTGHSQACVITVAESGLP